MLPLRFFKQRDFTAAVVIIALVYFTVSDQVYLYRSGRHRAISFPSTTNSEYGHHIRAYFFFQ